MHNYKKEAGLKDLTFCIFTLDREFELKRLVDYLSKFDANIIVLDASEKDKLYQNSEKFKYIHMPNMSIQTRFMKFSELVKTKYILVCPDDDFWSMKGLAVGIRYLETNLDYASVQGLRIRLFDFPNFHWIPDYINDIFNEFTQTNKITRLFDMSTKGLCLYSLLRSEDYKKMVACLSGVDSMSRDSANLPEYLFKYTLPVVGKHRVLPVFYSARIAHPYLGSDVVFARWVNDPFDNSALKFKSNMVNFYKFEIGVNETVADYIYSELTSRFSEAKLSGSKEWNKNQDYLKNFIFSTQIKIMRKVIKAKYFSFYLLLVKNHAFGLFLRDLIYLKKFLKKYRSLAN